MGVCFSLSAVSFHAEEKHVGHGLGMFHTAPFPTWPDGMEISSVCSSYISNMSHLAGYPGAMVREAFFPNSSWIENQMEGYGLQVTA